VTTRWTFYDPFLAETYEFEVNPKEGGTPARKRNMTFQSTAAANGRTLAFEGRPDPPQIAFSGVLLTEAQLNAFDEWFFKSNQILLTDDLGRTSWVVFTEFTPKRERAVHFPWKHSYTATCTVIDYP